MTQALDWPIVDRLGKQSYLFVSLLVFMLAGPVIADDAVSAAERLIMYGILTLVFITGPLAAARGRGDLLFTGLLAVGTLLTGVSSTQFEQVAPFTAGLGAVFFAYLTYLIGIRLLHINTEVNVETLWMAVNVYIMAGLFFAFLYSTVAIFDPDAFIGKFVDAPLRDQLYGFIYFSFVTLTTLGYGDLTPNNPIVGTITYMEALFGQLYVAIMIARLVGLYAAKE